MKNESLFIVNAMWDMRSNKFCNSIVGQVVAGHSIRSRLWPAVLEVLFGIECPWKHWQRLVNNALLLDVVRRKPAGPAVLRADVFTLHPSRQYRCPCWIRSQVLACSGAIVLSGFSDVVHAMEAKSTESLSFESNLVGTRGAAETYPHERNYTPDIWEKAFRCFIALLPGRISFGSLAIVDSVKNTGNAFGRDLSPCPVISQNEFLALGKHISPTTHLIVKRVLIGDCM
jgi:hypothetical protein